MNPNDWNPCTLRELVEFAVATERRGVIREIDKREEGFHQLTFADGSHVAVEGLASSESIGCKIWPVA